MNNEVLPSSDNSLDTSGSQDNSSTTIDGKGFNGLLVTQFFGALNDNVLKQFMTQAVAKGGIWGAFHPYAGMVNIIFAIPFILGSAISGQYADKKNKQWIALQMKNLEIPIAIFSGIAIYFNQFYLALFCFFLLSAQSTVFGPAKYGMIPELVPFNKVSKSNGFISLTTNLSAILAFIMGSYCVAQHQTFPSFGLIILLIIAIIGRISVSWIPPLQAKDPELNYDFNLFSSYFHTFQEMKKSPFILTCSFGWAFFYFLGSATLLILPGFREPLQQQVLQFPFQEKYIYEFQKKTISENFWTELQKIPIASVQGTLPERKKCILEAKEESNPQEWLLRNESQTITHFIIRLSPEKKIILVYLPFSEQKLGLFGAAVGVSIGIGSVVAGSLARGTISLGSMYLGGFGLAISFLAFFFIPISFTAILILLLVLGVFAGLYVVPLMTFIQSRSPSQQRGQFLGLNNLLSFVMVAISGSYDILLSFFPLTNTPHYKLGFCGVLTCLAMLFLRKVRV
ncbi:MAG: MFS transporter [Planctomycetota bacterium]